MVSEQDIRDIKDTLAEIKRLLKNAGLSDCGPARVYEINQQVRRDTEKIRRRLYGDTADGTK